MVLHFNEHTSVSQSLINGTRDILTKSNESGKKIENITTSIMKNKGRLLSTTLENPKTNVTLKSTFSSYFFQKFLIGILGDGVFLNI